MNAVEEQDVFRQEREEWWAFRYHRLEEQLETAQRRIEEAESIIHSALVTGSDPSAALRDAMDALGGESIPIATST